MKEGKGTSFSFFQTLPPFLQKLLTGLQIFADRKVPAVRPFCKGKMRGGEKGRRTGRKRLEVKAQ